MQAPAGACEEVGSRARREMGCPLCRPCAHQVPSMDGLVYVSSLHHGCMLQREMGCFLRRPCTHLGWMESVGRKASTFNEPG